MHRKYNRLFEKFGEGWKNNRSDEMTEKKDKIKLIGLASEEDRNAIIKILEKLDKDDLKHASDILSFTLILNTSQNLFEALGRMELMKQRIFSFADQPELLGKMNDIIEEEKIKKELKKVDAG